MRTFEDIMSKHPKETEDIIRENTHTNYRGQTTLSRDDLWAKEDVWDKDYEKVKDADRYRDTYRAVH